MVALVETPAYKVFSCMGVIPGGLLRYYCVARTAEEAAPLLKIKAGRHRKGDGELATPVEVFCKATVKAMNYHLLLEFPDKWTVNELAHVADQEIAYHNRKTAVHGIRAERLTSDLLFLQRQLIMRTPNHG